MPSIGKAISDQLQVFPAELVSRPLQLVGRPACGHLVCSSPWPVLTHANLLSMLGSRFNSHSNISHNKLPFISWKSKDSELARNWVREYKKRRQYLNMAEGNSAVQPLPLRTQLFLFLLRCRRHLLYFLPFYLKVKDAIKTNGAQHRSRLFLRWLASSCEATELQTRERDKYILPISNYATSFALATYFDSANFWWDRRHRLCYQHYLYLYSCWVNCRMSFLSFSSLTLFSFVLLFTLSSFFRNHSLF